FTPRIASISSGCSSRTVTDTLTSFGRRRRRSPVPACNLGSNRSKSVDRPPVHRLGRLTSKTRQSLVPFLQVSLRVEIDTPVTCHLPPGRTLSFENFPRNTNVLRLRA